jgi:hypothetical protein
MKRFILIAILVVFALSIMTTISHAEAMTGKNAGKMMYTKSAVDLRMDMRKLWVDHITWTRCYIVSALADLEDAGPVAERLLRNQDDIGNAIKPYYGDDAGRKLAALLRDHILIAAGIVKADLVQI